MWHCLRYTDPILLDRLYVSIIGIYQILSRNMQRFKTEVMVSPVVLRLKLALHALLHRGEPSSAPWAGSWLPRTCRPGCRRVFAVHLYAGEVR